MLEIWSCWSLLAAAYLLAGAPPARRWAAHADRGSKLRVGLAAVVVGALLIAASGLAAFPPLVEQTASGVCLFGVILFLTALVAAEDFQPGTLLGVAFIATLSVGRRLDLAPQWIALDLSLVVVWLAGRAMYAAGYGERAATLRGWIPVMLLLSYLMANLLAWGWMRHDWSYALPAAAQAALSFVLFRVCQRSGRTRSHSPVPE